MFATADFAEFVPIRGLAARLDEFGFVLLAPNRAL